MPRRAVASSLALSGDRREVVIEEIDEHLSTIGRSGTDELRQRIVAADRNRTVELIGQFGIGLLSAFIVAERVVLLTQAPKGEALRWESRGGGTYTVEPAERPQVGTTVTLHLRDGHSFYLDPQRLHSIIRTYADDRGLRPLVGHLGQPYVDCVSSSFAALKNEQSRLLRLTNESGKDRPDHRRAPR